MFLDFLFNALLECIYCVAVSSILSEFVVNFGKLLNLDFVKLNLENCVLVSKLGCVFCGELNVYVKFFTNVFATPALTPYIDIWSPQ